MYAIYAKGPSRSRTLVYGPYVDHREGLKKIREIGEVYAHHDLTTILEACGGLLRTPYRMYYLGIMK